MIQELRDPLAILATHLADLESARTAWQAAGVCASSLANALGARAVMIHLHDPGAGEIRIIGVEGPNAHELLGSVTPSGDDFILTTLLANRRPTVMRFDGELPRVAPGRLSVVGAAESLVATPVVASGECIAVVEIVDADERVGDRVKDACDVVAERLAAAIAARATSSAKLGETDGAAHTRREAVTARLRY
jgi:hypothetical protein